MKGRRIFAFFNTFKNKVCGKFGQSAAAIKKKYIN